MYNTVTGKVDKIKTIHAYGNEFNEVYLMVHPLFFWRNMILRVFPNKMNFQEGNQIEVLYSDEEGRPIVAIKKL